jgi:hypothetical protein
LTGSAYRFFAVSALLRSVVKQTSSHSHLRRFSFFVDTASVDKILRL